MRLQDGQADRAEGVLEESADPVDAELHATVQGLRDLRARIERAGRKPGQFTVEIRASMDGVTRLKHDAPSPLWQAWRTERDAWQEIVLLACPAIE